MIKLERALTTKRVMRSLTGLDLLKFNDLLITFTLVLKKETKNNSKAIKRKKGGGRHHTLGSAK